MEHRQEDCITSCSTPMRAKSAALAARATDAHRLQNCEMTCQTLCAPENTLTDGVAGGGRDGENGTGGGHVSLAKTRTPGASRG